eukprot:TRINITY_DN7237_c0_g1_i1.p1 TRINITY_DN7237_c0_g1~~TRINITY_DN7237_c0_g1_i1.p1  ORF type:complete len:448 (-),score=155.56 TRINITY_DN7237_c0_g1_i1:52-1374(-)
MASGRTGLQGDALKAKLEADWEAVQKKAFEHWVNSYLSRRGEEISDIQWCFSDGGTTVSLLELISRTDMDFKFYKNAKLKIHRIENNNLCLKWLKNHDVPHLTISSENLVDGDLKMILGFCWILLRHFRQPGMDKDTSFEDGLLKWVNEQVAEYDDIDEIKSFKNGFSDGKALLALCSKWDSEIVDYNSFDKSNAQNTISSALKLAEDHIKVPSLLDAKSLANGDTKEKQVILYVSLLFNAFQSELEKRKLAGESKAKALSLREQLKLAQSENQSMKETLGVLTEKVDVLTKLLEQETAEKEELLALRDELLKAKSALEAETAALRSEKDELTSQIDISRKERERLEAEFNEEQTKNAAAITPLNETLTEHLKKLHEWKGFLAQDRDYESEKIQLLVEKEISDLSFDDQLFTLAEALSEENDKLKSLDRERKVYLSAIDK